MSLISCLFVMLGGACGSLLRYVLSVAALPISRTLPLGTLGINIGGSFLIAFFGTLTLSHGRFPVSENLRLFVMVGFCGGYTTFSSFSLQTFDLLRAGSAFRALTNIVLSVVLCLAAVAVGYMVALHFNGGVQQVAQVTIEEEA